MNIPCGRRNESFFYGLEQPRVLRCQPFELEVASGLSSMTGTGGRVAMTKNQARSGWLGFRGNCSGGLRGLWTVVVELLSWDLKKIEAAMTKATKTVF